MAKINKLFGPGEYLVLKDLHIAGYREIQPLYDNSNNQMDIMYGGIRPRYMDLVIPTKSIVTIIRHEKNFVNGIFISTLELTCSSDRCFTYTCIVEGDTYNVLEPLTEAAKLLYATK